MLVLAWRAPYNPLQQAGCNTGTFLLMCNASLVLFTLFNCTLQEWKLFHVWFKPPHSDRLWAHTCWECRGLKDAYAHLIDAGSTRDMLPALATFKEFNALMGVEERIAAEERLTRREGEKLVVRVRGPTKPV